MRIIKNIVDAVLDDDFDSLLEEEVVALANELYAYIEFLNQFFE